MLGISRPTWTVRVATALATVSLVATGAAVNAQSPAPGPLTVEGAWARVSPMMERAGAAYLVIRYSGTTDDALVSVSSSAATVAELHETRDDDTGQMMMSQVESIPIPAGGMAELRPGSFHIMLIDLVAPLEAGAIVPLTLTFESGATLDVAAPVGDGPAAAAGEELQVLPISTQHWIGDNDLILQLFDAGSRPISDRDAPISLTLTDPSGVAREPVTPTVGRWAVTGRDLYVARVPLDQLGTWTATVSLEWGGETLTGTSPFRVSPDGATPPLGEPVPDVDTPTLIDVMNLTDAISSDPDQVAAFYWKSVTDELANDQPFVFVLDSYAFRPNEACGGALGIIHDIFIEYPQLAIIHAEPWDMRFEAGQLTLEPPGGPAMLASWSVAYGVEVPPWIFVVDMDGTLRAKFSGIFGTDELRAAMSAVSDWHPLGTSATPPPPVAG